MQPVWLSVARGEGQERGEQAAHETSGEEERKEERRGERGSQTGTSKGWKWGYEIMLQGHAQLMGWRIGLSLQRDGERQRVREEREGGRERTRGGGRGCWEARGEGGWGSAVGQLSLGFHLRAVCQRQSTWPSRRASAVRQLLCSCPCCHGTPQSYRNMHIQKVMSGIRRHACSSVLELIILMPWWFDATRQKKKNAVPLKDKVSCKVYLWGHTILSCLLRSNLRVYFCTVLEVALNISASSVLTVEEQHWCCGED